MKPPLVISQYLAERGLPSYFIKRKATSFGIALRAAYREDRGHEPTVEERWVGGKMRPICHYTTEDRAIFDKVYQHFQF